MNKYGAFNRRPRWGLTSSLQVIMLAAFIWGSIAIFCMTFDIDPFSLMIWNW